MAAQTLSEREQGDLLKAARLVLEQREREPATRATPGTRDILKSGRAPHARVGEDPLTSRPLYMSKAAMVVSGMLDESEAKLEVQEFGKFRDAMMQHGNQYKSMKRNSILVPLSWKLIPDDISRSSDFAPMRKALHDAMGEEAFDPDSMLYRKSVEIYRSKSDQKRDTDMRYKSPMSWIDQTTGGAMVAPPEFGDLIPLLRNKMVMPNIGARQVALPAQGSIQFPRQTGPSTVYERPENTAGTESNPSTDTITMNPVEFIGLVRSSNQLLTYSPGMAEAMIRSDMTDVMALTFDFACLSGSGGPNFVNGIINQSVATGGTVEAKSQGVDGNTWTPPDIARMIRKNMDRNSDVKTWIMRPSMWLGITETRADSIAAGDQAGAYLWNMFRTFGEDFGEMLRQRKVVTSNQVVNNQTKGSGTDLTYILGVDGDQIMVGMHGAVVLDANPWGDEAYTKNQTLFRSIMYGDCKIRQGAGVAYMPQLKVPNLDN